MSQIARRLIRAAIVVAAASLPMSCSSEESVHLQGAAALMRDALVSNDKTSFVDLAGSIEAGSPASVKYPLLVEDLAARYSTFPLALQRENIDSFEVCERSDSGCVVRVAITNIRVRNGLITDFRYAMGVGSLDDVALFSPSGIAAGEDDVGVEYSVLGASQLSITFPKTCVFVQVTAPDPLDWPQSVAESDMRLKTNSGFAVQTKSPDLIDDYVSLDRPADTDILSACFEAEIDDATGLVIDNGYSVDPIPLSWTKVG